MSLAQSNHKLALREAGWHSRGYLPHFDGREVPQFVSLHLFDSLPVSVLERWKRELDVESSGSNRSCSSGGLSDILTRGLARPL